MILNIDMETPIGKIQIPACYAQINPDQQLVAIGVNVQNNPNIMPESAPGVKVEAIGKLSEWSGLFGIRITNTLIANGWDFESSPDPDLILLTDERNDRE